MFLLPTLSPTLQQQEKFDYVMRNLLDCDDEEITMLAKLRWHTLRQIKQQPSLGSFSNFPQNPLGYRIAFVHMYMDMMNVCDKFATISVAKWENIDHYFIKRMFHKQFCGTIPIECLDLWHPTQHHHPPQMKHIVTTIQSLNSNDNNNDDDKNEDDDDADGNKQKDNKNNDDNNNDNNDNNNASKDVTHNSANIHADERNDANGDDVASIDNHNDINRNINHGKNNNNAPTFDRITRIYANKDEYNNNVIAHDNSKANNRSTNNNNDKGDREGTHSDNDDAIVSIENNNNITQATTIPRLVMMTLTTTGTMPATPITKMATATTIELMLTQTMAKTTEEATTQTTTTLAAIISTSTTLTLIQ